MLRYIFLNLKQASASPRKVINNDILTRWSERLMNGWPKQSLLPNVCVGLEGCRNAFNAMNSIRTCLFFTTIIPPCFLSLRHCEEIQSLHVRHVLFKNNNNKLLNLNHGLHHVALCGENIFLENCLYQTYPIVALENYTNRSENILSVRLPPTIRFVIGHENNGVSQKYIDNIDNIENYNNEKQKVYHRHQYCAKYVVYIPQCGTISSLNVVTAMGIALFYATLDTYYPLSRTLLSDIDNNYIFSMLRTNKEIETLYTYQRCFRQQLPTKIINCKSSRVDQRPIHPLYYQKDVSNIVEHHQHFRQLMLRICAHRTFSIPGRFGLSVIYENERDQRSLGGIVRNANAFLVDQVFYFGQRKINVVGTIGTQHYTPPVYLGPLCDNNDSVNKDGEIWAAKLYQRVEAMSGAPVKWWFLDCNHAFLYTDNINNNDISTGKKNVHSKSSKESIMWFNTHCNESDFILSLYDTEERLCKALKGGVVLLIPQEGILPPFYLLKRCTKILSLLPRRDCEISTAGLPVSVAVGIALQRLSAVMHPEVMTL